MQVGIFKKIDWMTSLISFAVSAAVFAVCLVVLYNNRSSGVVFNVLGTAVTVVLPLIISAVILRLFSKRKGGIKILFPKLFTASGAILILIMFIVAGIGQLLYSLSVNTYKEHVRDDIEIRTTEHGKNADIVMLLDASGSMIGSTVNTTIRQSYYVVSRNVCDVFIDSVAEECMMTGSAFADINKLDELKKMDAAEKKALKEKIRDTSVGGGTNLSGALTDGYKYLIRDSDPDKQKAIVIFSDGAASLKNNFFDDFKTANIAVYLVRPKPDYDNADDALIGYATDIQIDFKDLEDKGVSAEETIKKLADELNKTVIKEEKQEIVTPVYEMRTEVVFRDVLMLYDTEPHTVYGMIIAAVCMVLFSALTQAKYFRRASFGGFALGSVLGLAAFGVTIAGGALAVILLPAIFTPLLIYTLFIKIETR